MLNFSKSCGKRRQLCCVGGALLAAYGCFILLRVGYRLVLNQCKGNTLVQNLCEMYSAGTVGGPACAEICADQSWYFACPKTSYDEYSSEVSLRKHSDIVYSVRRLDFDAIVADQASQQLSASQRSATKEDLHALLGRYLSSGARHTFWGLLSRHIPVDQRKYLGWLLVNEEFILRSLHAGVSEVPAAEWNFCGPLYKSGDIHTNFTNSLVFYLENAPKVKSNVIKRLPVLQWLQVGKELFTFEQSVSDQDDEQRFLMCNLTADKIFLHNKCFFAKTLGSGACSFRVADLSTTMTSEHALVVAQRSISCTSDSECGYASCRGACLNGTCVPTWSSYMAGMRSVCSLFDSIYSRHLWTAMSSERRGKWQVLFDKCIEAMPQDSIPIVGEDDRIASWQRRMPLVISYNSLTGSLINFVTEEISIQTVFYNRQFGV